MKVTAMLKGMIDSNGHQPIQLRIYHEGKSRYVPTHIKVTPSLFEKGRLKKEHPEHKKLNQKIDSLIIEHQAQTLTGEKKKPKTYLFKYIDALIRKVDLMRRPGTIRVYLSQLEKLKAFTPDLLLSQVDNSFLYAYQSHLLGLGNSKKHGMEFF